MFVFTWLRVPPPTAKSLILTRVQKILFVVTLLYALLVCFSQPLLGLSFLVSALLLLNAYRQLSYFSCVIHQLFCWCLSTRILSELGSSLQNGERINVFDLGLANKVGLVGFSVFCFYFDFVAYKEYKAIALEVKEEGES